MSSELRAYRALLVGVNVTRRVYTLYKWTLFLRRTFCNRLSAVMVEFAYEYLLGAVTLQRKVLGVLESQDMEWHFYSSVVYAI